MTWIPAENLYRALAQRWPATMFDLANWAIKDAPSIYQILQAREIVECFIRAKALDAGALANIRGFRAPPNDYLAEPIEQKTEALRVLNITISHLDLATPVDVSAHLGP